jgi:hypothetical protein
VDCLHSVTNLGALSELPGIQKLSLGIYLLDDPQVLGKLKLAKLEKLSVGATKKKNIDLSPLATCGRLKALQIVGHTTNIEVVGRLRALRALSLDSMPNTQKLDFVNNMSTLRRLSIILGGRERINEIRHPRLEELEIVWVRGFKDSSFLPNFPRLQHLAIQDQIKLEKITFTARNASIKYLRILNCKALKVLKGIEKLRSLQHMRVYKTSIDITRLANSPMPKSLAVCALYSCKSKIDREVRTILDSRGYWEFG